MSGTDFAHGLNGYYRGCRCRICRAAKNEQVRRHRSGVRLRIPVAPVRTHVVALHDRGMSYPAIAKAAKVDKSTVGAIARGETQTVYRNVADALLGVTVLDVGEGHTVPRYRIKPMLNELERVGIGPERLAAIYRKRQPVQHTQPRIYWGSWDRLVTLYRILARRGLVDATLLEEVAR